MSVEKLLCTRDAEFDAFRRDLDLCHPNTRVEILRQIQDWIQQSDGRHIFWLTGMAGTGKSTIARTIAQWSSDQTQRQKGIDLGATFSFSQREGDRGTAAWFFPTIVQQLVVRIPALAPLVADAISTEPRICVKMLGEQFEKLMYRPLQALSGDSHGPLTVLIVVDALDECQKQDDIRVILQLCSRLSQLGGLRLKLLLTSQPEVPISLGFKPVSGGTHQDVILYDMAHEPTYRDISSFLKDRFGGIREKYNESLGALTGLDHDWPGDVVIDMLTGVSVPLFITAATICRFVGDPDEMPQQQLQRFLDVQEMSSLSQMEKTYLPVLKNLPVSQSEPSRQNHLYQRYRKIVGAVTSLAAPLSIASLAALLDTPIHVVQSYLRPLQSVLMIPTNRDSPVRILHRSFADFMLNNTLSTSDLAIDSVATHQMLLSHCLHLLSSPDGLRENICRLSNPGQLRKDIDSSEIRRCLSPEFQYACQYWVYHLLQSADVIVDRSAIHLFLRTHLLHWLEALSLMDRLPTAIYALNKVQLRTLENSDAWDFVQDARRFTLANRYLINLAPLQLYSSALIFSPLNSLVRRVYGHFPAWIRRLPIVPQEWSPERRLEGHASSVMTVTFSPNGKLLASGSHDKMVRLWDTSTEQEVQELEGHANAVTAVAFSPVSGELLASASHDSTVRLWDVSTGQELHKLEGDAGLLSALAFSPDGKLLVSASSDKMVMLWDTSTGQKLQRLEDRIESVTALAFSPEGKLFASASTDKTVRLWDVSTGQEVRVLEGHTDRSTAVAFSPDGKLLASASHDKTVRLWDISTGQELYTLKGHTDHVTGIAFSPDEKVLASVSACLRGTIKLWDTSTGQELRNLAGHTQVLNAVTFSPVNGKLLLSGSADALLTLWDTSVTQERPRLEGHTTWLMRMAFSPANGKLLASASFDGTISLWDTDTGREVQKLAGHTRMIRALVFSPTGSEILASASADKTIKIWNTRTGQQIWKLEGHTEPVRAIVFSPVDDKLLASSSRDGTIRLWDIDTGLEVRKLEGHAGSVGAVAFSPIDGKLLASASVDKTVKLWDTTTGHEVRKLEGHSDSVTEVAFSPIDKKILASACYNSGAITLWDVSTGKEVQRLEGHIELLARMAFSPTNGKLLATASFDGTVRLWDISTGQETAQFRHDARSIEFTDDGQALLTDRGSLYIDRTPGSSVPTPRSIQHPITITDYWIQWQGQNLLWLPLSYRWSRTAVYGNVVAFGHPTGRVNFLHLDFTHHASDTDARHDNSDSGHVVEPL